MGKKTYLGIDIVRISAAILVMLFHLSFLCWLPTKSQAPEFRTDLLYIGHAFSSGWVGVDIFFVISGFVIAFSASEKSPSAFLVSRARRLYPTAWLCATLTLPFIARFELAEKYLLTMLLSPVGPWVSSVYWTLAIEVVFYLLTSFVLKIFGSSALTAFGMFLGFYSSLFWWLHVVNPFLDNAMKLFFMSIEGHNGYLLLLHHGCYFGIGIMLWNGATYGWRFRTVGVTIFFGLSGILGIAGVGRALAQLMTVGSDTPNYLVPPAIWCVAVLGIMASIVWSDKIERALSSRTKIVRFLGLLTYPLYLVHEDMGRAVMVATRGLGAFGALAAGIIVVVAVSVMVTVVERRIQALVGGHLSKPGPAAQLP